MRLGIDGNQDLHPLITICLTQSRCWSLFIELDKILICSVLWKHHYLIEFLTQENISFYRKLTKAVSTYRTVILHSHTLAFGYRKQKIRKDIVIWNDCSGISNVMFTLQNWLEKINRASEMTDFSTVIRIQPVSWGESQLNYKYHWWF